jgi:hypothetical protein
MMATFNVRAQQQFTDSSINLNAAGLQLTPAQKIAMKELIWEYRQEDSRRRKELRHRMFIILNVQQQMQVRRWWRWQIKMRH